MDAKHETQFERKMNKKWSEMEVNLLLDYLLKYTAFEHPTAQRYYTKFIEDTGINATWKLLRCKVRHLRTKFKKAKEYRDSFDSNEKKMLKICPQFIKMDKIFGEDALEMKLNEANQSSIQKSAVMQKCTLNSLSTLLLDSQKQRISLLKQQLQFEKEKFCAELDIRQKEMNLKEKELEIKLLALQNEDRIKQMEIDKQENIINYELQLKFNNVH